MPEEKSKLDAIDEKLDEILEEKDQKRKKSLKLPFKAKVSRMKAKKNYVTVMVLNENRNVDFVKEQIVDQTVKVDGIPRLATGEYIFNYKNKPLIILPNWSVEPVKEPFSPSINHRESLLKGSNSFGYRLLLGKMIGETIKTGAKKLGGLGMSIGVLIIIGVIIYALFAG